MENNLNLNTYDVTQTDRVVFIKKTYAHVALAFLAKYGGWNDEEEDEETEAPRMGLCETQTCEEDFFSDSSGGDDAYSSSEEDEQYRYSD